MPASIASCATPAELHCLSKLSGFTAADLIDDTLNPVGPWKTARTSPPSSKRPRTATPFEILREERFVAGR